MKFRKKPVEIEARQFDGTYAGWITISEWIKGPGRGLETYTTTEGRDERTILIPTLEGDHRAAPGDWIIRGVKGEFYPCKPDIFEATYEPAEEPSVPAPPGVEVPEELRKAILSYAEAEVDAVTAEEESVHRAEVKRACELHAALLSAISRALANARAEGRQEGIEEAATICDGRASAYPLGRAEQLEAWKCASSIRSAAGKEG